MLSWLIFKNYLMSRRSGALVRIIAWHCIIGIGMGVAALVIVLSVMEGFNLTIRNRMLSVEPHLVLTQGKRPLPAEVEQLSARIQTKAEIDRVDRFESQDLIIRSIEGLFGGAIAKGYDAATLDALLKRVWQGTKKETPEPQSERAHLQRNEVIAGVDLARGLGIFEGDEVILVPPEALLLPKGEVPRLQKYKVKSLMNTQIPEVDSKLIFYNLSDAPSKVKTASLVTGFEVRLKDPYKADVVKADLLQAGYNAQTWMDRDTSLFFALKMESYAMSLFLILAVLITSFSIVIVMVLLMNQKRRDIGMLMALGLSLRRTQVAFLRVGLMLSFMGIFSGALVGSVVCLLLDRYPMELLPDIYTDSTLPAKLTWRILFFVLSCSSFIAVMGSWLPVWRGVLQNPSESLRKPSGANV